MRITPEYFIKVIDTAVGRTISDILREDISNYKKIDKVKNFLDYEFEILPITVITPDTPLKEIRTYLFLEEDGVLFQFSYITEDIDIRITFGNPELYCYLYNGDRSRNISKEEIDEIEEEISYHLLAANNFFDIDKEELDKILKVKSK